ncbi:hypothetical protein E2636_05630 [Paenisporosarcina antarctica]|uniref:Uncharacterized protein n=1 Tax=Paenisporosarcina antarctica TaxID=417367 RepID=A0A4P6ZWJ5_9BACL|nr:hypothetical protein E2636_05630 [Paenisporosarcina antarctica]
MKRRWLLLREKLKLKAPQERRWPKVSVFATSNRRSTCFYSDEETEAKPAKSVHRSGNKRVSIVTLLKDRAYFARFFLFRVFSTTT